MSIVSMTFNQKLDGIYSVAKDGYGDNTRTLVYSDVDCRWEEKRSYVVGPENETMESTVNVWIDSGYTITYSHQILKDSEYYTIVSIENRFDLDGHVDHIRLYLV